MVEQVGNLETIRLLSIILSISFDDFRRSDFRMVRIPALVEIGQLHISFRLHKAEKHMKIRNSILAINALAIALLSPSAVATLYTLSGAMDVFQATTNPDDIGNGSGEISGNYNDVTNLLNYTITWSDLTSEVINMHFHVGSVGVPGGVDLGISGPWSSPQSGVDILLDVSQENNLLSGDWYVNIHTADFVGGEIRGQVNVAVSEVPEPWTLGLLSLGLAGIGYQQYRKKATG